jgi:excisionase family DNA binding protein
MPASKSPAHAPGGLSDVAALLGRKGAITLSSGKTSTRLTPPVVLALREVVAHLLRGDAVAVVARRSELTTQEAADLLGLSRQHVVRLVDAGKLPVRVTKVGAHRRIAATDVLRLKAKREADAAHARAIADLFAQEVARIDGDRRR